MSIVRMLAGQAGDGTTFVSGDDEAGRVAGVFKLVGRRPRSAVPRRSVRQWASPKSTRLRPATR